jgi:formate-dependent phosphoribosylglycinamide formyltransferase (GAR transformylase)
MWYANINAFLMGVIVTIIIMDVSLICHLVKKKKRFLIILSMTAISTAKLNSLEKESDLYVNGNL